MRKRKEKNILKECYEEEKRKKNLKYKTKRKK